MQPQVAEKNGERGCDPFHYRRRGEGIVHEIGDLTGGAGPEHRQSERAVPDEHRRKHTVLHHYSTVINGASAEDIGTEHHERENDSGFL